VKRVCPGQGENGCPGENCVQVKIVCQVKIGSW
jgi:hypothetical protein